MKTGIDSLCWLDGNIDTDPMFADTANTNYSLRAGSPCIDRGAAFYAWEGDTLINLKSGEYVGTAPDMGAFEYGMDVGIKQHTEIPQEYTLYQNYPNPFNPITTIEYTLPVTEHVVLTIYDILGRKVTTLVDEKQTTGHYKLKWDAKFQSSGIYLYQLHTKSFKRTIKLILLK